MLLSLGGGISNVSLPDGENARTIAKQLWNLFGAGKGEDAGLRPFGNVALDGFDVGESIHLFPKIQYFPRRISTRLFGGNCFANTKIFLLDNEDHSTAHYSTFVSELRENMNTEKSRKYHISAAPQCPRPDASIPLTQCKEWISSSSNSTTILRAASAAPDSSKVSRPGVSIYQYRRKKQLQGQNCKLGCRAAQYRVAVVPAIWVGKS